MLQTKICHLCRKEKDLREFKVKINGQMWKNCIECNDTAKMHAERGKCSHGKRKSQCRECSGTSFCIHRRQKWTCRECGGTSICSHGRIKSQCHECGGTLICIHGRQKPQCKLCNDAIKITIKNWIKCCRYTDKKYNRFDPDHFIDTDFLRGLVED